MKVKSVLTYEGLKWPSENGLLTNKGVERLHELKIDSLESYLRILESLDEENKLLSKELEGIADDEDVELLMTIPGIGYYTAVLIKSEIGGINRFVFPERLCSYAGLVPSTHASGKTVRHGSITKEGSRWLRWVIVEAAQTHVHKYDTAITKAFIVNRLTFQIMH